MSLVAILGTLAALCTTGAFVPQIIKIHKQGGEDLSYGMLGVYLLGVLLWLAYGLQLHAPEVIWANSAAAVLVLIAIVMKWLHSSRTARLADAGARAAKTGVPVVVAPHNVATKAFPKFRRPRIAVDMDEVIADAFGKVLDTFNAATGSKITREELSEKGFEGTMRSTLTPEMFAEYERMCHSGDFFADLELMEGSQEALRALSEDYEIFYRQRGDGCAVVIRREIQMLQRHFLSFRRATTFFVG